ncbi:hypothetical protein FOZ61_010422 [Perkinsus olseni]|uniref:Uncharacterized protein n=1 Tax=Perkinsus olseni TaxID=32597 RepID=A0A7J6KWJ1_PEROL|nr:hypothetical protein FOZ61_010422 [Perkinsus olseni]
MVPTTFNNSSFGRTLDIDELCYLTFTWVALWDLSSCNDISLKIEIKPACRISNDVIRSRPGWRDEFVGDSFSPYTSHCFENKYYNLIVG